MRSLMLVVVACLSLASPVSAQSSPDWVKHANECRLAEQIMRTGHPQPYRQWARGYIGYCGAEAWGRAAAAAVTRLRNSANRQVLEIEWGNVRLVRDSSLFAAASDIAGDPSGSIPARVFAIIHLMGLVDPNRVFYYELLTSGLGASGGRVEQCFERMAAGRQAEYQGVPLPRDYSQRIAALLQRIAYDASQPGELRSAALCF